MGTVHAIRQDEAATLAAAAAAFLGTLDHPETHGTRRAYASTLRALRAEFGDDAVVADLEPVCVGTWFAQRWGSSAPATWNRNLDALRSAQRYWQDQRWMTVIDLAGALRRRKRAADRSRALTRAEIGRLLDREDIAIRERVLWWMLYETGARSAEVLRLDVEDLDLGNRRAKVTRKGSAVDWVIWQTGTARLLPRLLKGRKSGPLFLTGRRSRVPLPPGDVDPASGKARLSAEPVGDPAPSLPDDDGRSCLVSEPSRLVQQPDRLVQGLRVIHRTRPVQQRERGTPCFVGSLMERDRALDRRRQRHGAPVSQPSSISRRRCRSHPGESAAMDAPAAATSCPRICLHRSGSRPFATTSSRLRRGRAPRRLR
jgi:integrase